MPVAITQPVYPPTAGGPLEAIWGIAASEHVVQRFTDIADRNAKWTSPPTGAICVTTGPLSAWMYDGSAWVPFGGTIVGEMKMWSGTTIPSGYMLADGRALSRTTYALLFATIGTTWGAGDGSATFNIPDMRSRSPMGAGTGVGLSARTVAQKFGAESVGLAIAHLPAHNHSLSVSGSSDSQGTHNHKVDTGPASIYTHHGSTTDPSVGQVQHIAGTGNYVLMEQQLPEHIGFDPYGTYAGAHSHNIAVSGSVGNTGSGTPVPTVQPTIVVNYIIYVGV